MFLGGNTPFFVIISFVVGFVVLAIMALRQRDHNDDIVQLKFLTLVIGSAIQGSSLISELFLISALLGGARWALLGRLLLVSRLATIPITAYKLLRTFGPIRFSRHYQELLAKSHFMASSTLYTVVILVSFLEISLLKLLPWRATEFSRISEGWPDMPIFRVCNYLKLSQSIVAASCQITFLTQVYQSYGGQVSTAALVFVGINVSSTALLIIIAGLDILLRSGVLSKIVIVVPEAEAASSSSSSSSSKNRGASASHRSPNPNATKAAAGGGEEAEDEDWTASDNPMYAFRARPNYMEELRSLIKQEVRQEMYKSSNNEQRRLSTSSASLSLSFKPTVGSPPPPHPSLSRGSATLFKLSNFDSAAGACVAASRNSIHAASSSSSALRASLYSSSSSSSPLAPPPPPLSLQLAPPLPSSSTGAIFGHVASPVGGRFEVERSSPTTAAAAATVAARGQGGVVDNSNKPTKRFSLQGAPPPNNNNDFL